MWDERYSSEEYAYGTAPNEFLKSMAARIPKGRVLSLGDGEGRNGVYLAGQGFEVLSADASPVGLAKARKLAADRGVRLDTLVTDLTAYEIRPGDWDGIVSIFFHLPSAARRVLHRKVVAGLRPGGAFVLEAYTPAQLRLKTGGPSVADMLVTLRDLKEELPGLVFEHAEEVERAVVEGKFHTGRAAVVQVLARKTR
jgi:SAM-dependent methyltransferase